MKITCLCPVYGNPPWILEETIKCFVDQTYPDKHLILFDDYGNLGKITTLPPLVDIISTNIRRTSLIEKYEYLIKLTPNTDAYCIWDADDLYLPEHLQRHVEILEECDEASYPDQVWSTYTGSPQKEESGGRFWASLAFTARRVRAFPLHITNKATFDQQNLRRLIADGYCSGPPTYCFRWADTNAGHVQGLMKSPDDETWYERYLPHYPFDILELAPQFREKTKQNMEYMIANG